MKYRDKKQQKEIEREAEVWDGMKNKKSKIEMKPLCCRCIAYSGIFALKNIYYVCVCARLACMSTDTTYEKYKLLTVLCVCVCMYGTTKTDQRLNEFMRLPNKS